MISREDLPPDQQPGRRDPALLSARRQVPAEAYYWPYWKVVLPSAVAFAAAGLIVAWSLVSQPLNGFDLAGFAVACVWVGRAGQVVACLATAALLIAAAPRPRWRRTVALTVWVTLSLQIGFLVLAATQYPGNSCAPRPGWAAITLTDTVPGPTLAVPSGARIIVTVPGGWWSAATDVTVASPGILREGCTILLPGGGRRTIFAAIKPGTTFLGSTVAPTNHFFVPSWGGEVIVRGLQPGCSGDTAYEEVRIGEKNPGDCHARKQMNERGSGGEWVVGSIFKLRRTEPNFVNAPREKFWRFSSHPTAIRQITFGEGNP